METVKSLRQKGYKVRVLHNRVKEYPSNPMGKFDMQERLAAKGGSTVVEISYAGKHSVGTAICHPKDNYDKKEGVKFALSRALSGIEETYSWEDLKKEAGIYEYANRNSRIRFLSLGRMDDCVFIVNDGDPFYKTRHDRPYESFKKVKEAIIVRFENN